jgi:hypothetical protein
MRAYAIKALWVVFWAAVYWNLGLLYWHMMAVNVAGQEIVTPFQHFLAGGWDYSKSLRTDATIFGPLVWPFLVVAWLLSWVTYGCVWLVGNLGTVCIASWKLLFGGGLANLLIAHPKLWMLVILFATILIVYHYPKRLNKKSKPTEDKETPDDCRNDMED